jgi:hypothetical protein
MSQENVELVRRAFEKFNRGGVEPWSTNSGSGGSGSHRGFAV